MTTTQQRAQRNTSALFAETAAADERFTFPEAKAPALRPIRLAEYPTMSVEALLAELDILQPALTAAAKERDRHQKGSAGRADAERTWAPLLGAVATIRRALARSAEVDGGLRASRARAAA